MELTNLPMFGIMRRRISWLNQRQEVLAQNIANADTPEFPAHDLKAFDGRREIRQQPNFRVDVSLTSPTHLKGRKSSGAGMFKEGESRWPYETAPAGNSVILEEQMVKLNETTVNHQLVTQLYRKHLAMIKMVAGRGGGR